MKSDTSHSKAVGNKSLTVYWWRKV